MQLAEGELYHVFNRGNNKETIFPQPQNYSYFLKGVEKNIKPYCDILAWCLMPNHFHFLVHANQNSVPIIKDGSFDRQKFSQGIKQLLSSYTKAINKQENRTGSLFQQKTKAICVSDIEHSYELSVFHYIHQNPFKARMVERMEDWEFSSFRQYLSESSEGICNTTLAVKLLDLDIKNFYNTSYQAQLIYPFDKA